MQKTRELSDIQRAQRGAGSAGAFAGRARGRPAPLSLGQRHVWRQAPDGLASGESVVVHLPGRLDEAALERSVNEILRRHEAWRTSFPVVDGHPVQVIHPAPALALPVADLRGLPADRREGEASRLAAAQASVPFDLARGPLVRATLVRLADRQHRLCLTLHRLIFDGPSLSQTFLGELHALYEAFSAGRPSPLPELHAHYADFALWQRERLRGDVPADQLAYWRRQLAGAPGALELPADRPRPAVGSGPRAHYAFALPERLSVALGDLGRREGVDLFTTLAAACTALLFRYTGQDDLLIGTPVPARRPPEVEGLLGFFLDALVLRTDASGDPTFRELLARVRDVVQQARAHREVPFEYLTGELRQERDPLLQVMLALYPAPPPLPSGWTLTRGEGGPGPGGCDLSLLFEERPEGLAGHVEYSSALFDEATIARMAGHWRTLLEGIAIDAGRRLSELPLLTGAESLQLLVEWNATRADYPGDLSLPRLFEAQVERTPDAVALVFEGQELTYRQLGARANQLAHHLQSLGVGPEVLVGVYAERSVEMVVGLLGVLKAGGAYVPLDPAYPQERLAFMLQDSRVAVLLTQRRLAEQLPQQAARVICLDSDWPAIARERDTNPRCAAGPQNLAYVIYTSGSTGRPKGVAIAHRSTVAFIHWARGVYAPADLAGVLASTSICFDLSVFELFVPLSCGGTVLLVENALHLPRLAGGRWPVTLLNTVPSAAAELARSGGIPATVGTVNLAGEPLRGALVRQIYRQGGVRRVFNLYGPTEDTTYSTCALARAEERDPTIGRPLPNSQVYILDPHLRPVPIRVAGELYIGGDGLARGYLNRPDLTAERFIPDPFSPAAGARLYKTGDLARYLPDGNIEFLGRVDHQVKIRGFRVELGEVEAALGEHPAVREAVVVAHGDAPEDKRLVAYVVLQQGRTTAVGELRDHLMKSLPTYMLPSAFVWLEELPLTPNGKVDRKALPAPDPLRQATGEPYAAPASPLHHQLVQIWEDLLGVRPVGIRDNFFYLGGHSLLAARLVAEIERVFGKKLPFATLFARPTIEQLAQAMGAGGEERSSRTPLVAVQAAGGRRPFFYLHGAWNSDAFYCFHLARRLGAEQPFYAQAPYNFDGLRIVPSVEEMAAAHIQSLRAVQPQGPYQLGGFCNGGLVAYEMARQLHAAGQEVGLLVLIVPAYAPTLHRLARGAIRRAGKLLRWSQERQLECFLRLRHVFKYALRQRKVEDLKAFRRVDPSILTLFPTADALLQDDHALLDWAVTDYGYPPYAGRTTLIWAREEPFPRVWRRRAAQEKGMELRVIPGTHLGCRTDHISSFAEELARCIGGAQTAGLKESGYREGTSVSVD